MSNTSEYTSPKVWTWDQESGGKFASINRPIAGPTHNQDLPVGRHPLQLYSLATPNGVRVTVMLEELLALGHSGAEYDAWLIRIHDGDQFGSGFVHATPNSKIPALLDHSGNIQRFADDFEEIFHHGLSALDMGEKLDKKVRQDDDEHEAKGCPECGYKPVAKRCMACVYEKQAPSLVETLPGEMREVVLGKKKLADDHRHLWAQVCTYARSHSKPEKQRGRAWNLFRNITGQAPSNLWSFETTPNVEITRNVRNKITSLNVAYSKPRAR